MGKFKIFHSERPVVCGPAPATPAAEPTSEGAATVTSPMIAAREVPGNPAFRGDESQTSGRWQTRRMSDNIVRSWQAGRVHQSAGAGRRFAAPALSSGPVQRADPLCWKSTALGTVTKITVDRSSVLSHNVTHN
jgi:hypothetical protein